LSAILFAVAIEGCSKNHSILYENKYTRFYRQICLGFRPARHLSPVRANRRKATYQVISVNTVGLKSEPANPVSVEKAQN
jgi:hypothetical protein